MRDPVRVEIACVVEQLLRHFGVTLSQSERRAGHRLPLRTPVSIVPIDDNTGKALSDRSFSGITTNISAGGVGLAVQRLPDTKYVVISFWKDERPWLHLLCEPRWIRFTTRGFHWVGCKIKAHLPVGFVEPPAPPVWMGPDVEVEEEY